jgi:uncharacterized protein YrzB (UPF0473 family)
MIWKGRCKLEEKNIITLTDKNGKNIDYELLDIIKLYGNVYTVFYPTDENDTEVVIFRVEDAEDVNKSKYIIEQDDLIIEKVYKIFKEKYKDKINFTD